MTLHVKTAMILLTTLALGIAIGALSAGTLLHRREGRRMDGPPRARFIDGIEQILNLDDERADSARAIVDGYSERFEALYLARHTEMRALMDSMRVDLATILTESELERLTQRFDRGSRMGGPGGKGRRGNPDGRRIHQDSAGF
jgi:hypothetical protein